jgi:transposase-like protein
MSRHLNHFNPSGAEQIQAVNQYPAQRKEAILRQMMPQRNRPVSALAQENGFLEQTLYTWRRNLQSQGALAQCSFRTENRHNKSDTVVQKICSLPADVPVTAKIYSVSYYCPQYACSWSYNPDGGYAGNTKLAPISARS